MAESIWYALADHGRSDTLDWARDGASLGVLDRRDGKWIAVRMGLPAPGSS